MQSKIIGESFRCELDERAISKGASRRPGFANGVMVVQGYTFGGKFLQYLLQGYVLTLTVIPDGPQAALAGAVQHAQDPSRSAREHADAMKAEITLSWDAEFLGWLLEDGSDGSPLGIGESSYFSDESLAQCCAEWLCG